MTADSRAFAPGHVSVVFRPHRRSDPARTGSTGAGLTLSEGVSVRASAAGERSVRLNGDAIEVGAVERVLAAFPAVAIEGRTRLPIGAGFGVSGAFALATALAANDIVGTDYTENDLVGLAHRAEVEARTGLGDVVAQARGGVPVRTVPGGPGHGVLDGIAATASLEYVSFGGIDTGRVLAGETTTIEAAGDAALERLLETPNLTALFGEGRRFAREAGLLTERCEEAVGAVLEAGGEATMAMLGETVVALDGGLSEAGYDATSCTVHPPSAAVGGHDG